MMSPVPPPPSIVSAPLLPEIVFALADPRIDSAPPTPLALTFVKLRTFAEPEVA